MDYFIGSVLMKESFTEQALQNFQTYSFVKHELYHFGQEGIIMMPSFFTDI